jgi:hypothetical protein
VVYDGVTEALEDGDDAHGDPWVEGVHETGDEEGEGHGVRGLIRGIGSGCVPLEAGVAWTAWTVKVGQSRRIKGIKGGGLLSFIRLDWG